MSTGRAGGLDAAVAATANLAGRRARELNRALRPSLAERIGWRYAQAVAEALAYREAKVPLPLPRPKRRGCQKRLPGPDLALRLQNCRESALRFPHEPADPFTHNQAEQDVPMRRVRQKISGGFNSEPGAQDFATLHSVLSRGRKQGRRFLEALLQGPEVLFAPLPA